MNPLPILVPDYIAAVLDGFDKRNDAFTEMDVGSALRVVRKQSDQIPEAENAGAWAEVLAFSLMPSFSGEKNPWGTYFGPSMWGEDERGNRTYSPSLDGLGEDFLNYWLQRATASIHPILKARYADLIWDLARLIGGKRPKVEIAHLAIDAYLEADARSLYPDDMHHFPALKRALRLAVQLRDTQRRDGARAALLTLHSQAMDRVRRGERGAWWLSFREMLDNKGAAFSDEEREQLVADVEEVHLVRSDQSDSKRYEPHDAQDAAKALIDFYRAQRQSDDVKRLQASLGACIEQFAALGDAMLAAHVLPEAVEQYRACGRNADARRVQRLLETKIGEANGQMGQFEHAQQIPKEQMDAWLDEQADGGPSDALKRIALGFQTSEQTTRDQIAEGARQAPLFTMLRKTIHDEKHIAGEVGSPDDDELGTLVFNADRHRQLSTFWLYHALNHVVEIYALDAQSLVDRMNHSGLFEADTALLKRGVQAWLDADDVLAAHVLVAQIERAIRQLMDRIGQPVTKPHREVPGVSQAIGIGDVLRDAAFVSRYGQDLKLHLTVLYADPRGWNLRNRVAHGLLPAAHIEGGMTSWLIQTLLLLSESAAQIGGSSNGNPA